MTPTVKIAYLWFFLITEKGQVFVWGYGILGKGPDLSETSNPEMIPPTLFGQTEFNPSVCVTKVRCGLSHFAAVTGKTFLCQSCSRDHSGPGGHVQLMFDRCVADRGELFVWGKNIRGCLGIGRRDDQYFPWRVREYTHCTVMEPLWNGENTRCLYPGWNGWRRVSEVICDRRTAAK